MNNSTIQKIENTKSFFKEILNQGKFSYLSSGIRLALENYKRANSALWVTSLCYFTVLSMAPIAAILFSIGSWLGMKEYLIGQIKLNFPLDEETINIVIGFADRLLDNARNGVLAGVGFVFLGWTLISMFSIVEKAFNDIWQVKKSRVLLRKITDYFSFLVFTPAFILVVNGTTIIVGKRLNINTLVGLYLIKIIPNLAILIFFTALYMLMPNTKVKFIPAFISSIFTSILCIGFQYFFVYLQSTINTYNKIYGSFASLFILIFWLKILWFFIILGGHISYFLQNRHLHPRDSDNNISFKSKEIIGLIIVTELVKRYKEELPAIHATQMAETLRIPLKYINNLIIILKEQKVVAEIVDEKYDEPAYIMTKNIEKFTYGDLFHLMESYGTDVNLLYVLDREKYSNIIEKKDLNKKLIELI
ncbi:MAG: YihY/virulence factor BrkB family protein [Fusobacteriaceae bacterium]|nr:YihY/virulence factor BrkB family protein [Fusobacteriaceae bacterium]